MKSQTKPAGFRVRSTSIRGCWQACCKIVGVGTARPALRTRPSRRSDGYDQDQAAGFVRAVDCRRPRAQVVFLLRHPVQIRRALRYVDTLPDVTVSLSPSHSGAELARHFGRRLFGFRPYGLAQTVLLLPPNLAGYLRGRSRQALRTGLNAARGLGLTADEVSEEGPRLLVIEQVYAERREPPGQARREPGLMRVHNRFFAAYAGTRAVGMAAVLVDDELAHLQLMLVADRPEQSSAARYLLHTTLVAALISDGVRVLVVESALRPPEGRRHFARRLGYVPANLRVARR